mmetsp:Transcript_28910/g.35632  ORF Transcript_28910/g.35632 Transcript_28910/m.35632 type:complete len:283 (+) Transcript_28910:910-1758(+)
MCAVFTLINRQSYFCELYIARIPTLDANGYKSSCGRVSQTLLLPPLVCTIAANRDRIYGIRNVHCKYLFPGRTSGEINQTLLFNPKEQEFTFNGEDVTLTGIASGAYEYGGENETPEEVTSRCNEADDGAGSSSGCDEGEATDNASIPQQSPKYRQSVYSSSGSDAEEEAKQCDGDAENPYYVDSSSSSEEEECGEDDGRHIWATYYDVLGIPCFASQRDIRKAYKALALRLHPDKNKSRKAVSEFVELREAYEVLSSPEKRLEYDKRCFVEGVGLDEENGS